jgi:hypothetical protein
VSSLWTAGACYRFRQVADSKTVTCRAVSLRKNYREVPTTSCASKLARRNVDGGKQPQVAALQNPACSDGKGRERTQLWGREVKFGQSSIAHGRVFGCNLPQVGATNRLQIFPIRLVCQLFCFDVAGIYGHHWVTSPIAEESKANRTVPKPLFRLLVIFFSSTYTRPLVFSRIGHTGIYFA